MAASIVEPKLHPALCPGIVIKLTTVNRADISSSQSCLARPSELGRLSPQDKLNSYSQQDFRGRCRADAVISRH